MMRKMHGEEVSEEQVDAWVAEAEEGYDVEELQKRIIGRPARGSEASRVVPVRLTDAELDAVMKRADKEHLNRSEAIRAALSDWARSA
ncbi:ribbon-helix-helix protein, CopG family [Corynebacterium glyciniphilum]|nr:ribbon-helix-helix protein, CopG family [Corynebacterium glyciniphilum]